MAKSKKLTNAQKKANARLKKEWQEKGILPPDKPKLNRQKFVEEAEREWNQRAKSYIWEVYLVQAISLRLGKKDKNFRVSAEAVGVAKVLKLAIRLKEFSSKLESEGRTKYTLGEKYEFIKDILEA